ncbi:EIN3-binding F-box protein 1-like isoform X1 [Schistocerca americana]|uniref:EIN3-binding F-box protein 1-like isoform X1 n=1 Tax=Schistocerca americana TaxID=7009 RepID=UPI001F4FB020|nr:EIN3-binding F-box protein 1-like isoform X1 [Schistocerca americana]XP_049806110.1 uncharacterized protein LOC126248781 isoform X1 [Schistocerca nitens]XP_049846151.1 uncharacterized protein LOC126298749 isoform X1 [Schistocerca gregaria]XP_049953321.1 uncharacterized protein LOC126469954 isoform X1 [Schistocerca serialis cubense]
MPLRNQPPALRRAAMSTIASHFELLCYGVRNSKEMSELIQSDAYLDIDGPFQHFPPELLEDLLAAIAEEHVLHRKHLHMLVTPAITSLDLSLGTGDTLSGFRFMLQRCKNLKKLNISYLRHMTPNILLGLMPCFNSLVSLNLSMTMATDQMLEQIGLQCPLLVELQLVSTPMTDRGLVRLCVGSDGTRLCQRLARLAVADTSVTVCGAAVALQSLPCLSEFDFDNIFEALELLETWDHELEHRLLSGLGIRLSEEGSPRPERLRLSTLLSATERAQEHQLDSATRLCPDTKTVALSNAWLPSEALYKFMLFENLCALSLTNCDGLTLDFEAGVLPLLCVIGGNLQNLILSNFTFIDILAIGRACPQLLNLALSNVAEYEDIGTPSPECFNQLQALELWSDPQADLGPNLFRQLLLFSPSLRNILFKGCENLTDKLLNEILQINPMKNISHVTLDHCHGLTNQSLHYLLDLDNELAVIRIWCCQGINKHHNNELMRRICDENMDVYLEWFQYDE